MYKNTFESAFADIAPKASDEEFARKILNAPDRQKPRARHKKAVVIPIAAATAAIVTLTASAAGGLDLFGVFQGYFSQRTEQSDADPNGTAPNVNLSAASMTAVDEVFDVSDYTVQVNGLIADSHYVYLYYDIIYKDEKYFENGEVAAKYQEGSPVNFFGENSFFHSAGWGEPIGVNGNTVSYMQDCAGEFETDPQTGEYPFNFFCSCVDDPCFIAGECTTLDCFRMEVSVPPAKKRVVEINGEIPLPDGRTTILEEASFGPLSLTLCFDNDCFYSYLHDNNKTFELKMKDGTVIDLKNKSIAFSAVEDTVLKIAISDDPLKELPHDPSPDEAARENTPAVTTVVQESVPVTTTLSKSGAHPDEFGMPCVLEIGYGTAIDPTEIAEIKFLGETFSVE